MLRTDLHELLCLLLGSRNVYFQPPTNVLMNYPAIRYKLSDIDNVHADDGVYLSTKNYELILIDSDPDSETVDKLIRIRGCRFIRQYVADNLNHWVFQIPY